MTPPSQSETLSEGYSDDHQHHEMDQRDIEPRPRSLPRPARSAPPLPTLTDEEVVALDGVQHEQLVALPWLSAQDASKELMCAIALRGLLAKELVYPVVFEGETEPSRLHATEEITGALTLRRSGSSVVSVERTVSTGKRWLYGYLHDEGVCSKKWTKVACTASPLSPAISWFRAWPSS